jgi:hypothetical protein
MATTNVSPPPISVRIVDEDGLPTRELKEYLYRLWARTSDPKGNLLDQASGEAGEATAAAGEAAQAADLAAAAANNASVLAGEAVAVANTSIELSGTALEQIDQLAILVAAFQDSFIEHTEADEAHASNGKIVGQGDIAELDFAGLVKMAATADIDGNTTATTSGVTIAVAPATYTVAHYQTIIDLLNDRTAQLDQLISDYNGLTDSLASFRASLIAAGIMDA